MLKSFRYLTYEKRHQIAHQQEYCRFLNKQELCVTHELSGLYGHMCCRFLAATQHQATKNVSLRDIRCCALLWNGGDVAFVNHSHKKGLSSKTGSSNFKTSPDDVHHQLLGIVPMKTRLIEKITLSDFRCFRRLEVSFDDKLTVLVGRNGGGKTAILDGVAIALAPFVGAFDEGQTKGFDGSDIRQFQPRPTISNELEHAPDGVSVTAFGTFPRGFATDADGLNKLVWTRRRAKPTRSSTTTKEARNLVDLGRDAQRQVRTAGSDVNLPIFAYYGTGRLWQAIKFTNKKLQRTSRTIGYTDCLNPASDYKMMSNWFRYWSICHLSEISKMGDNDLFGSPATEFSEMMNSVSSAVDICLQPAGWHRFSYSFALEELVCFHGVHGRLPVSYLSDGVKNMIGLVADIAIRATKLNPHLGSNASKLTNGVVLIDEVDMHLHPSWQHEVLSSLGKAFPQIQFIVTTHSPQVVSSAQRESLRILDEGEVFSAPIGTEGARSGRLLKEVFDLQDDRPVNNEATKELQRYLYLVDEGNWNTEEATDLRRILDARYAGSEPDLIDADIRISNEKWEQHL